MDLIVGYSKSINHSWFRIVENYNTSDNLHILN